MVEKRSRKDTNDQKKRPTKKKKISSAKKVLFDSSESECNEEIKYDGDEDECETIEEQWFCDICAEPYENSKAGEVWVQCQCSRGVHKPEYRSRLRQECQCFSRSRSHKFRIVAGAGAGPGVKNYRILVIFVQNLP